MSSCIRANSSRVKPLWIGMLGLACLAFGQEASAQQSAAEVHTVRFEGNSRFSGDSLARAIVTRKNECRSFVLQPFCWTAPSFPTR